MSEVINIKAEEMFPLVKEILKNNAAVKMTVTGSSMLPFLRQGKDSVELSDTGFFSIKRSDIVLILRDDGQYVLHRVIKIKNGCLYIMGDSQKRLEGPIRAYQLIAKASRIWRGTRQISCTSLNGDFYLSYGLY